MKKILTLVALCFGIATSLFAEEYTISLKEATRINPSNVDQCMYDASATAWRVSQSQVSGTGFKALSGTSYVGPIGLFKFDGSEQLTGKTIQKATLQFKSKCTVSGKNSNVYLAKINTGWTASTATFANTNSTLSPVQHSVTDKNVKTSQVTLTWDVLSMVENDEDMIFGFAIYTYTAREQEITDIKLIIEAIDASASTDVTVNYVCNGTTVKSSTIIGTIGNTVNLSTADKATFDLNGKRYLYVSDNGATTTVVKDETVVTVNVREAATWNYTIVSEKGVEAKKGTNYEGSTFAASYPRYILNSKDSTLVEAKKIDDGGKQYNKTFTLDVNNKVETVNYNVSTKKNIVFYTEGENISGTIANTFGNVFVRASNGLTARTEKDVIITKLPAGKYKITAGVFSSAKDPVASGMYITLGVGLGKPMKFMIGGVNLTETTSEEIVLSVTTPIYYLADGSGQNSALDYIYIEKTGYMAEAENPYGDWLEVDNTGNTGDKVNEGYLVVDPTTKQENGMITFPEETPETEGADAGDAATGINNAQTAGAQVVGIYSANGAKAAQLQKGLNIIKLANGKSVKVVK